MVLKKLIIGLILSFIGMLFIILKKNISKGAAEFYKKVYTKENLQIMFMIVGIILIILGIILIFSV